MIFFFFSIRRSSLLHHGILELRAGTTDSGIRCCATDPAYINITVLQYAVQQRRQVVSDLLVGRSGGLTTGTVQNLPAATNRVTDRYRAHIHVSTKPATFVPSYPYDGPQRQQTEKYGSQVKYRWWGYATACGDTSYHFWGTSVGGKLLGTGAAACMIRIRVVLRPCGGCISCSYRYLSSNN